MATPASDAVFTVPEATDGVSALLGLAWEEAAGPALLLDAELRIVRASPGAVRWLGAVPIGERAPAVLCGTGDQRPIAEALARGLAVSAEIRRLTRDGERLLNVRAVPLGEGEKKVGYLLFLSPLGEVQEGERFEHGMWFQCDGMRKLMHDLKKVAKAEASVLIRGETGSGKELVARAIHAESPRREGPFVGINCAAIPANLLESELFGHLRGAFTGAIRDSEGHFRAAHKGTLLLDEVAELPLEVQAKLLRVLQEKVVVSVGASEPTPIDVRVIAATHRSLREEVEAGRFRADLMYRLRVVPIYLAPLRERADDVLLLAQKLILNLNQRSRGRIVERIAPGALRLLRDYDWPGNVRELENALEYAFILGEGPVLTETELPPEVQEVGQKLSIPKNELAERSEAGLPAEARRLARALERASGSRQLAAASLGMSRATLWRKMKQYGLDG